MAKKPILTLDIGSHSLKLAEFIEVQGGGLEMTRYAVSDLGIDPQSDADRTQFLLSTIRDLVAEAGCTPGPVQVSIAGHAVFSRFVKLPPVDASKVYQIVQYEAAQHVPFPMNEVVWDYQLVEGKDADVDVMIAAVKNEIINQVTDCVTFAGLQPDIIDVAPMALYNAVRYNYDNLPGCTLVVDIGARSTDLVFIEGGRVFSRNVPVAGNQITQSIQNEFGCSFDDAEALKKAHAYVGFGGAYESPKSETVDKVSKSVRSAMARLHQELNRSINFYRGQQGGSSPSLILLTGGSSVIPYTDSFLKEKLKIETDYFNPFNNVAVAASIPSDQIGTHVAQLGALSGLALRKIHTCPIELNLIPARAEEETRFKKRMPFFAMAAATALVALGVWVAGLKVLTDRAAATTEKVQGKVALLSGDQNRVVETQEEIARVEGRIQRLSALQKGRSVWRNALKVINDSTPDGIWLTHVSATEPPPQAASEDEGGRSRRRRNAEAEETAASSEADSRVLRGISIVGMGYTDLYTGEVNSDEVRKRVVQFRNNLRESGLFDENETEIITQRVIDSEPTFEFTIRATLKESQAL